EQVAGLEAENGAEGDVDARRNRLTGRGRIGPADRVGVRRQRYRRIAEARWKGRQHEPVARRQAEPVQGRADQLVAGEKAGREHEDPGARYPGPLAGEEGAEIHLVADDDVGL